MRAPKPSEAALAGTQQVQHARNGRDGREQIALGPEDPVDDGSVDHVGGQLQVEVGAQLAAVDASLEDRPYAVADRPISSR